LRLYSKFINTESDLTEALSLPFLAMLWS